MYLQKKNFGEIIDELRVNQYKNKISKNHKVKKNSQENNSETVTNDKETYISPKRKTKINDNLIISIIII